MVRGAHAGGARHPHVPAPPRRGEGMAARGPCGEEMARNARSCGCSGVLEGLGEPTPPAELRKDPRQAEASTL